MPTTTDATSIPNPTTSTCDDCESTVYSKDLMSNMLRRVNWLGLSIHFSSDHVTLNISAPKQFPDDVFPDIVIEIMYDYYNYVECEKGGDSCCEEHTAYCHGCQKTVCHGCVVTCDDCNKPACPECVNTCPLEDCDPIVACVKCAFPCSECNSSTCMLEDVQHLHARS